MSTERNGSRKDRASEDRVRSIMDEAIERYPPNPGDKDRLEPTVTSRPQSPAKLPIQATVDLHGLNREQALAETERFIQRCFGEGKRKILIIHGKGNHSPEGGVLRTAIRRYIATHRLVGETGSPGRNQGGSGATWAVLRYRSR